MKDIINHPTRSLMRMCGWVSDRVSDNATIVIMGVLITLAVFLNLAL